MAGREQRVAADEPGDGQMLLPIPELEQRHRDRAAWERRLASIGQEQERKIVLIRERYRVVDDHVFPAAVVFVVPRHEAIR